MNTVRIVNKLEGLKADVNNKTVELRRQGVTEVDIQDWIELKKIWSNQISGGYIHPEDSEAEKDAIRRFREESWSVFESLGRPATKAKFESNGFSSSMLSLAKEWILEQEHNDTKESIRIARESNSIANEAKEATKSQALWTKLATIVAFVALIISIYSLFK